MSAQPVGVLAYHDALIAQHKAQSADAYHVQELPKAEAVRAAVAELMALLRAMVETDRLVGREDIANLFWPVFIKDARAALARVSGGAA